MKSLRYATIEDIMCDIIQCNIELCFDNGFTASNGVIEHSAGTVKGAVIGMFLQHLKSIYDIQDPAAQKEISDLYDLDWMEFLRDHIPVNRGCAGCDGNCDCTGNCGNNCECGC